VHCYFPIFILTKHLLLDLILQQNIPNRIDSHGFFTLIFGYLP